MFVIVTDDYTVYGAFRTVHSAADWAIKHFVVNWRIVSLNEVHKHSDSEEK